MWAVAFRWSLGTSTSLALARPNQPTRGREPAPETSSSSGVDSLWAAFTRQDLGKGWQSVVRTRPISGQLYGRCDKVRHSRQPSVPGLGAATRARCKQVWSCWWLVVVRMRTMDVRKRRRAKGKPTRTDKVLQVLLTGNRVASEEVLEAPIGVAVARRNSVGHADCERCGGTLPEAC